jgi:Flp pilus assembly protein TadG
MIGRTVAMNTRKSVWNTCTGVPPVDSRARCACHFREHGQRGGTLLEFVVIAPFFFMMLVGIVAAGNLFFTHNAFVDATRRGARYASMQAAANPAGTIRTTNGCDTTGPNLTAIKNYAIYGNAAGTGTNVSGLQPSNICVEYSSFGVETGTVTVSIQNFNFNFVIPGISQVIAMPAYRTTVSGESAGAFPQVCP